jgi:RNA polymerase sigma-70 factor (ECF subfamily)
VRDFRSGLRELSDIEDSPADVVELRIESERVNRALLTLPENQRKAVTLAHLKGYSHTEVSAILHIPVGTVKTRIRTGISRLREELAIA